MIEVKGISKYYGYEQVLDHVSIRLPETGFISIVGPSGCGKSTLLHIIAGLDDDYDGEIVADGKNVNTLQSVKRLSIIFQRLHLIPWLSVKSNIRLYSYFHKHKYDVDAEHEITKTSIRNLSPGQRQRVAFYRALYMSPEVILCDEPTAALDPKNAVKVMEELKRLSQNSLVILVSHDHDLVEKYSDIIYTMADGEIVDTTGHIDEHERITVQTKPKKQYLSQLRLALSSLFTKGSHVSMMVISLMVSLFCIMMTFTASFSLKTTINDYITSLVPPMTISYKAMKTGEPVNFKKVEGIDHVFAYPDNYELLGLSFEKRYQYSKSLFITDETGMVSSVIYGHPITHEDEIILPLKTAKTLSRGKDVTTLLNKTIYIHYKHHKKVKAYPVTICGITQNNVSYDAFYQQEDAHMKHLFKMFHETPISTYGILYYHGKAEDVLKHLKKDYPQYRYKQVGKTTEDKVNTSMKRVEYILTLFSALTILSSLFLVGEVLYLNVMTMKKDYAIMYCFGAKRHHIIIQFLLRVVLIHFIGYILSFILFTNMMTFTNKIIILKLVNASFTLTYSKPFIIYLYIGSLLLMILVSFFSLSVLFSLNITEVLKKHR